MNNLMSEEKAKRLAQTKGIKGFVAMFVLLGAMCFDQFILDIPFANVVFPILIICAASMNVAKNVLLVSVYSVLFELSCLAWFPANILRVQWWLLEVWLGYMMPFFVYKLLNRKHKNVSVWSYAAMAALSELLYFWVSVVATIIIWGVHPLAYVLNDLPFEAIGCAATFVCTLPVAALYKISTGELAIPALLKKRKAAAN
ncbi:MAG: hypothetical protein HFE35_03060 [Clostridia bacterium]|nr:hypothetical protein [Clostridia bacterium]